MKIVYQPLAFWLLTGLLYFSKKDFEYDVYSLVRAFYPRSEDVLFG